MKQHAIAFKACAWIKQWDVTVYQPETDEPGLIAFKVPARSMAQLVLTLKSRLQCHHYSFERHQHYQADLFVIDRMRSVRLVYHYGRLSGVLQLIDSTEVING